MQLVDESCSAQLQQLTAWRSRPGLRRSLPRGALGDELSEFGYGFDDQHTRL